MKTLLLIDANSLIYRSFFALPPFTSPQGEPTGALYGLSSILLKIIKEQKPDYVAAAFDRPEPTFRKEKFDDYKATRPKAPDELITQIIASQKLLNVFNIVALEKAGFEADDIIATLVSKFEDEEGLRVVVLSGDLDLLQLVNKDKVVVETPQKGISNTKVYDEEGVYERFGVTPTQIPEYKGLVGDTSDNIPGVRGIGPKTAAALIQKFGSVENIINKAGEADNLDIPKREKEAIKKIKEEEETARLSRDLAEVERNTPIDSVKTLEDIKFEAPDKGSIIKSFEHHGFKSLIKRLENNEEK